LLGGGTKVFKEFKDFIAKGSVFDLAVGIVLGLAFGTVINSFVNDILMPPIGLLLGKVDFSNLFIQLSGGDSVRYQTLAGAKAAGVPTLNYGQFINTLINFLIVAFAVFLMVKQVNRFRTLPPGTKDCPYCYSKIPEAASRCPDCTSELARP